MFRESSPMVRILLAATLLVASWGCRSSRPRNHLVLVGPGEDLEKEIPVLSRNGKHQMVWRSLDGLTSVQVVFNLEEGQLPPFKNMACQGSSCTVPCVPRCAICTSGEINPALVLPPKGEYYYYDVSLSGAPPVDPKIIIKP